MIKKVFSVYDKKALVYEHPFYYPTKGEATRFFGDLVSDQQTKINRHPEDYSLFLLGSYDDHSGKFEPLNAPEFIMEALDFINPVEEQN